MKQVNSTQQFYECVVAISDHLSRHLFNGNLSSPLFTLTRGSRSLAHYVAARWHEPTGNAVGEVCLNPTLFAQHSWLRLMQCVAEQLCHHWQHLHGNPSRPGYHNREWANKLEAIGLMPSSTGIPGGRRTGQIMSSYPLVGGSFLDACEELAADNLHLPLTGRWTQHPASDGPEPLKLPRKMARRLLSPIGIWSDATDAELAIASRERKRKLKYSCPRCGVSVWGRPGLELGCRGCDSRLRVASAVSPSRVEPSAIAAQ